MLKQYFVKDFPSGLTVWWLIVATAILHTGHQVNGQVSTTTEQLPVVGQNLHLIDAAAGLKPASEAEILDLMSTVQRAVSHKDPIAFQAVFDSGAFLNRASNGLYLEPHLREVFTNTLNSVNAWNVMSTYVVSGKSDFQFLRLRQRGHYLTALCRTIASSSGGQPRLTYFELIVKVVDGKTRVVDILKSQSTLNSEATRPFVIGDMMAALPRGRMDLMDRSYTEFAPIFHAIGIRLATGNVEAALYMAERLPVELQGNKSLLAIRCYLARDWSLPRYERAVRAWETYFPNDRQMLLEKLELATRQQDHVQANEVAIRLLKLLNDPFLNYYRVPFLTKNKRFDEAFQALQSAMTAAPNRSEVWEKWIALRMLLGDHPATVEAIETTEKRFPDLILELSSLPGFLQFSASPEGHACLGRRLGF